MRPECWINDDIAVLTAATRTPVDHCNFTTLILAKIVNLLSEDCHRSNHPSPSDEYNTLWDNLQVWRAHRLQQALPLLRTDSTLGYPFPTVVYTGDSSAIANTFYHTGCILLLCTGQVCHIDTDRETETRNPVWHARELCGLSITNATHAGWVNQVHPLYIAGQVFGSTTGKTDAVPAGKDENYAPEKIALLEHLAKIERETGWQTSGRAADLRRLWGFH